jgi:hypothetical protein
VVLMAGPVKRVWTDKERLEWREHAHSFRMEREAARAKATRKAAGFRYVRGDLHMHTVYSDGSGTVEDMVKVAQARGLDFIFVTDHGTIRQKAECAKYPHVWWGQEPGAGPHHVCILAGARKYTPCLDMRTDAEKLRALGYFFFYPHPVGWYPRTHYSDEKKDALAEVGPEFAIEVMNGIFRAEAFHEEWEEGNVALWDRYLKAGCRVTGLGATDAHFAPGVGNVWTGVLGARLTMASVLKGLHRGCVYASNGPAVNLTCGHTQMGGAVKTRKRKASIGLVCADGYGLSWARVVQDGRVVHEFECRGKDRLSGRVDIRLPAGHSYVRAECAAADDLRAYSNPIYFNW